MEAQSDFDKFRELAPDRKAFLERWIEKRSGNAPLRNRLVRMVRRA